jgi:hypothetical protein
MLLQEVQKLTEMGGSTPALDTLRVHLAAIQALWPDLSEVALSALPSPSGAPMAE